MYGQLYILVLELDVWFKNSQASGHRWSWDQAQGPGPPSSSKIQDRADDPRTAADRAICLPHQALGQWILAKMYSDQPYGRTALGKRMHIIRFGQVATVADRNGAVDLDCRSPSYIAIQPVSLPDREGDASIVRSRPGQLVGGDRLTRSMPVAVRSERWRVGLRFILSHEACQASGTRRAPSSHTYSWSYPQQVTGHACRYVPSYSTAQHATWTAPRQSTCTAQTPLRKLPSAHKPLFGTDTQG